MASDEGSDVFAGNLRRLIKARFPLLSIATAEESRVLGEIASVLGNRTLISPPRHVYLWSTSNGFGALGQPANADTRTPLAALTAAAALTTASVLVMLDLHPWLGNNGQSPDTQVVRALKDTVRLFRDGAVPRTLILISPTPKIPADLQDLVTMVDYPLPTEPQIRELLDAMIKRNTESNALTVDPGDDLLERLAKAALGLTSFEAENAFARAMVDDGHLSSQDVLLVQQEKGQIVRKSGVLEMITSTVLLSDVGGLDNLKTWLTKRAGSWLDEAQLYGLPAPKGVLVTGVPGCGKSLTAKAMASAWSLPLVRMDIGRIFGGLVGESELNMRKALSTAEAVAPCVLWIDEIEKGFAAGAAGTGDSGTSARVFGTFLTWMQEKTAAVFVMATANNISLLPPEFLRKGRFDEIFFIDLPTTIERVVIFRLHITARLEAGPALGDLTTDQTPMDAVTHALAAQAEGYSGAEIEQAVISACFDAFDGRRRLTLDDLQRAVANTVPLSVTQAEQIAALRAWANVRAVAASVGSEAATARGGRPVDA